MSAKYLKKRKRKKIGLIISIVLLTVLLIFMLLLAWGLHNTADIPSDVSPAVTDVLETIPNETEMETAEPSRDDATEQPMQTEQDEDAKYYLGKGLTLLDVGKYTGVYMEDGTDEVVSNVLMLIVSNEGEQDIQFAEFTIPTSNGDAKFSLSTLPAGEKIVLLEQNRMAWSANEDYSDVNAANIAVFSEPVSLCEDQLKIQALDGVMNITNISGSDITGNITIYYKNAATDLLYGGITYRIRLEGGLKADEIQQIMASHFTQSGSRIMFVTIE